MADYGIKVIRAKSQEKPFSQKNYILNSENVLLKIHKQGAFKATYVRFSGFNITIDHSLGYRPFVLVYAQRVTHAPAVDNSYHLLDWSYFGATQQGEFYTQIYSDRLVIHYQDTDAGVDGAFWTILGYYYIFKEKIS